MFVDLTAIVWEDEDLVSMPWVSNPYTSTFLVEGSLPLDRKHRRMLTTITKLGIAMLRGGFLVGK